ncbi:MAG: hypothetical protein J6S47_08995 [Eubacteriaceae bacterium]|nr:hypothetical protein [Eubacteriaceae bacterium]
MKAYLIAGRTDDLDRRAEFLQDMKAGDYIALYVRRTFGNRNMHFDDTGYNTPAVVRITRKRVPDRVGFLGLRQDRGMLEIEYPNGRRYTLFDGDAGMDEKLLAKIRFDIDPTFSYAENAAQVMRDSRTRDRELSESLNWFYIGKFDSAVETRKFMEQYSSEKKERDKYRKIYKNTVDKREHQRESIIREAARREKEAASQLDELFAKL